MTSPLDTHPHLSLLKAPIEFYPLYTDSETILAERVSSISLCIFLILQLKHLDFKK